jgi:ABC-type amino acid transport system permease subunit
MSHIWQNHSYLFSGLLKTLSIAALTLIFSSIISILFGIFSIDRFSHRAPSALADLTLGLSLAASASEISSQICNSKRPSKAMRS